MNLVFIVILIFLYEIQRDSKFKVLACSLEKSIIKSLDKNNSTPSTNLKNEISELMIESQNLLNFTLFKNMKIFENFSFVKNNIYNNEFRNLEEEQTLNNPYPNKASFCESINDCFNCTMYSQLDVNCKWSSYKCSKSETYM